MISKFRFFRSAASAESSSDSGKHEPQLERTAFGFATPPPATRIPRRSRSPRTRKWLCRWAPAEPNFIFPPFRNPGRALVLFLVNLVWTGLAFLMYQKHAADFLFHFSWVERFDHIAGFLHVTFGTSRIAVRSGEILSRTGISARPHAPNSSFRRGLDCARREHATGRQLRKSAPCDSNAVEGRAQNHARRRNRQPPEARWIVSQIETLAGLKLDTHVEVDLPLGVSPQPLKQSSGQVLTQSQQRVPVAASAGVFLVHGRGDDWLHGNGG